MLHNFSDGLFNSPTARGTKKHYTFNQDGETKKMKKEVKSGFQKTEVQEVSIESDESFTSEKAALESSDSENEEHKQLEQSSKKVIKMMEMRDPSSKGIDTLKINPPEKEGKEESKSNDNSLDNLTLDVDKLSKQSAAVIPGQSSKGVAKEESTGKGLKFALKQPETKKPEVP